MRSVQNCTEFISSIKCTEKGCSFREYDMLLHVQVYRRGGNDYKDPGKGKHFLLYNISNRLAEINTTKKYNKFKL
jgi:hypothetical protein